MQSDEAEIRALVARWMAAKRAGDVDTVLSLMTDDVGTLPPELQPPIFFAGAVTSTASEPEAGRALIRFLGWAQAAPVIVQAGLDPLPAR